MRVHFPHRRIKYLWRRLLKEDVDIAKRLSFQLMLTNFLLPAICDIRSGTNGLGVRTFRQYEGMLPQRIKTKQWLRNKIGARSLFGRWSLITSGELIRNNVKLYPQNTIIVFYIHGIVRSENYGVPISNS